VYNLDSLNFYGDFTLEDHIQQNVFGFLNYGLLEVGGFYSIALGQTNYQGQDESLLVPFVNNPSVTGYTYYAASKSNWVWESNISLKYAGGSQPLVPTGITVNGVAYPTGVNVSGVGYHINFNKGAVVFDSPLAAGSQVKCPHTIRAVQLYPMESYTYRYFSNYWTQPQTVTSSGVDNSMLQAHLPAIFVGIDGYSTKPTELGSRNKWTKAKLRFDIVTTNPNELKKLCDTLYMMESRPLAMYDIQKAPKPLNYRGTLVSGIADYKYNSENYLVSQGLFKDGIKVIKLRNTDLPFYTARVFAELECQTVPI